MKKLFFIPVVIICFFSCNSKKTATQANQNIDTTNNLPTDTTVSFFPVTAFIKGQMRQFDSLLITPLHIVTIHEKSDSQWIKREALRPLLQSFLTPEINETNLIKYFKETKFNDQTLNAITLAYDPIASIPDSISLSNWIVYVNPKKGDITKVYIVKHINEKGQTIIQQLTWQTGKFATLTEILNKPDGNLEVVKQEKIVWSFDE